MDRKISVIIPAYNVAPYLERCLYSVIRQTYKNLEIIVVDDGSADATGSIAERIAGTDGRVRVVHQENRGLGAARNTGLDLAAGELLAFADSDDWLETDAYEVMAGLMEKHGCDIVTCGRRVVEGGGSGHYEYCLEEAELVRPNREIIRRFLLRDGFNMAAWDKLYRAELFEGVRYPENFLISEDFLPAYSVLSRAESICLSGLPLYNYFRRPGSITMSPFSERSMGPAVYAPEVAERARKEYPELRVEADAFEASALLYAADMVNRGGGADGGGAKEGKMLKKRVSELLGKRKIRGNPYLSRGEKLYIFFLLHHLDLPYIRLRDLVTGRSSGGKALRQFPKGGAFRGRENRKKRRKAGLPERTGEADSADMEADSVDGHTLLSFIVPVYQVEKVLDRCVESLKGEDAFPTEIILVDDGSPDSCPLMCDAYAGADVRIRVIHQENRGLSEARNAGLRAASGEYVWFVDSDDFVTRGACGKLREALKKGEDVVAFGFNTFRLPDTFYVSRHGAIAPGERVRSREFLIRTIREGRFFVQAWTYAFRREFLLENGLFFRPGLLFEDVQLMPEILLEAKGVIYVDEMLYTHEIRPDTITTSRNTSKAVRDTREILDGWKERFDRVADRELKGWLYHELVNTFLYLSRARGQYGWWAGGMNFASALSRAKTPRLKARVVKYEGYSVCRRFGAAYGIL